jgi:hypothetical protein
MPFLALIAIDAIRIARRPLDVRLKKHAGVQPRWSVARVACAAAGSEGRQATTGRSRFLVMTRGPSPP